MIRLRKVENLNINQSDLIQSPSLNKFVPVVGCGSAGYLYYVLLYTGLPIIIYVTGVVAVKVACLIQ